MVKGDGFEVRRRGLRLLAIFCSIKLVDYMHSTSTIWKWEKIMLVKSSQLNKVENIQLRLHGTELFLVQFHVWMLRLMWKGGYINTKNLSQITQIINFLLV